jgi:hypothetical protein
VRKTVRDQFLDHFPQLAAIDAKKCAGMLYYHCQHFTAQALGNSL